jgi:hypothetical protein
VSIFATWMPWHIKSGYIQTRGRAAAPSPRVVTITTASPAASRSGFAAICAGDLFRTGPGRSVGRCGGREREEALHHRVIPDVAGSAHAANDAAVGHQTLELFAGVLGCPNSCDQGIWLAAPPDGHRQGVRDQLGWLATQCRSRPSPAQFPANREFYREI